MRTTLFAVVSALALLSSMASGCGSRVVIDDANEDGEGGAGVGGSGVGGTGVGGTGVGGTGVGGTGVGGTGVGGTGVGGTGVGGSGVGGTGVGGSGVGGTGPGSSVSSGSGGMICPSFGDVCTDCLSASCSAIYCDCFANPDCFKLINCENDCGGGPACEQSCYASFPNGAADVYALSSCGGMACANECPGSEPLDPCSQCMVDTCESELNGCLADAACVELYGCLDNCGSLDLSCQQGCYQDHGAGVPKLELLLQCTETNCGAC